MAALFFAPSALVQHFSSRRDYINFQKEHITTLEEMYANDEHSSVSEQRFASFNLQKAIDENVKLSELQFLATHNSYKQQINSSAQALINKTAGVLGKSRENENSYTFETLTEQFNNGIRSIELDVMKSGKNLRVCHIPILDMNSSCYDFELTLKEIKMWSENNPNHLPILMLLEPKVAFLNEGTIFHKFSLLDAKQMDSSLEEQLGNILYTPKDMMGDYSSFKELRESIGGVSLKDTLGKVIAILHPSAIANDYYNSDESLMSQKMFPGVSSDRENAMFIVENDPYSENIPNLIENNFLVRTRADSFPDYSDARRKKAVDSGAQIITSDYPPREIDNERDNYISYLKDNFTIILRESF